MCSFKNFICFNLTFFKKIGLLIFYKIIYYILKDKLNESFLYLH